MTDFLHNMQFCIGKAIMNKLSKENPKYIIIIFRSEPFVGKCSGFL